MRIQMLLIIGTVLSLRAADLKEAIRKDTETLQGTWIVESGEVAGKAISEDDKRQWKTVFAGDKVTQQGVTLPGFTLHPDRCPKGIDLWTIDLPVEGIYKFEGDKLHLCIGGVKSRPSAFKTEAGQEHIYLIFKRDTNQAKKDLAALRGSWKIVGMESGGKKAGASEFEGMKLSIRESKAALHEDGRTEEATFTLDPAKKPKWVDVTMKDKSVRKGLYVLDGDTLELSIRLSKGSDRPKELTPAPDDLEGVLFRLARIKP